MSNLIEMKRTMNNGNIASLKGYKCDCGRIYGLEHEPQSQKIQEISYIRCKLEHEGIEKARIQKQYDGFSDLEIKRLAREKLDYDLKLIVGKSEKDEPRCRCGHLQKFHHKFFHADLCYMRNCDCHKFEIIKNKGE